MSGQIMVSTIDWKQALYLGDDIAPRYRRLQEKLRLAVVALPPGTAIPGEIECAALAGVSRETVRKAMSGLVTEGLLVARRGSGTITSCPRIETGLNRVQGFTEAVRSRGRTPRTEVIRFDREPADVRTSQALEIGRNDEVWVLERIRLIDEEPAMVETAYLPCDKLPGFDRYDFSGSLYSTLETAYNLAPTEGTETIFAINADRELARQLDIPIAAAILASIRNSRHAGRIPVEHTRRNVRPELCSFTVHLANSAGLNVRSAPEIRRSRKRSHAESFNKT